MSKHIDGPCAKKEISIMNHLVTRCPNCATSFRITNEHLKSAGGSVRCGSCLTVFSAKGTSYTDESVLGKSSQHPSPSPLSKTQSSADFSERFLDLDNKNPHNHELAYQVVNNHQIEEVDETWALALLAELEAEDADENTSNIIDLLDSDTETEITDPNQYKSLEEDRTVSKQNTISVEDAKELAIDHFNINSSFVEAIPSFKEAKPINDNLIHTQENLTKPFETEDLEAEARDVDINVFETPAMTAVHDKLNDDELLLDSDENLNRAIREELGLLTDAVPNINYDHITDSKDALLSGIQPEPVQMHWEQKSGGLLRKFVWFAATLFAFMGLATQYASYNLDQLARQEQFREFYVRACSILKCQLPNQHDISKFRSNNLVVRTHPKFAKVLVIDTIIVNEATYKQPFPNLKLSFSDLNGQLVASRVFNPDQYLGGEMTGENQIPAQQPIHLSLEIADPGEKAVNYSLIFAENSQFNY